MTLEQLKQQQVQLVLQRASAKDTVEQAERQLQQVGFAIQVLEANSKATAEDPQVN